MVTSYDFQPRSAKELCNKFPPTVQAVYWATTGREYDGRFIASVPDLWDDSAAAPTRDYGTDASSGNFEGRHLRFEEGQRARPTTERTFNPGALLIMQVRAGCPGVYRGALRSRRWQTSPLCGYRVSRPNSG